MERNNNIGNEKKEFEKLKTLLKELPKVNAPDNFEFNLMTKIRNKNFEVKSEKKKSIFYRVYAPTFALAASVILVFMIFTEKGVDADDPWNLQPKLRPEIQSSKAANFGDQIEESEASLKSPNNKIKNSDKSRASSQIQELNIEKNNLSVNKRSQPDYPFDKSESVDLDELLTTKESSSSSTGISRSHLAGKNDASKSQFKGFFIRQKEAEAKKESLRIHEDSLKQLNDSLKK